MCRPKVDTSVQDQMRADSERARQEEEARQERIRTGTEQIDNTFSGFNGGFFDNYRSTIMDFYQPQLDQRFESAQDDLTFALARAGTLNSSAAADRQAELTSAYDASVADLLADAEGQTNQLRQRVSGEKSNLISLLNATGDADRASNDALARSQILFEAQPDYNILPDIFGGIASGIGGFVQNRNNQQILDTYFGTPGNPGNSRIVR